MSTNETQSDAKPQTTVKLAKAIEAVQADVTALINKTIAGFELPESDVKGRKYIFRAVVAAAAATMKAGGLDKTSSLVRGAQKGVIIGCPYPVRTESDEPESDECSEYSEED